MQTGATSFPPARAIATMLGLVALAVAPEPARADPLELENPTPRRIEVRFEVSPADQPGRLDAIWSPPRSARIEAGDSPDRLQIRIPASEMEQHLRSTGTAVIPGTFSDFVWVLDRATGEVLSSRLEGRIHERIAVGPFATRVAVGIRVDMSTSARAGFRTTRAPFGVETHAYCAPNEGSEPCVAVASHRFDPRDGYVNAVGVIRAATPVAEVRAFSPLGEVRFSEQPVLPPVAAPGPPERPDAVFSTDVRPASATGKQGGWHGDEAMLPASEARDRRG
ncbi:MAG: hypothetical protein R3F35_02205 [Myxococcota bacterium]